MASITANPADKATVVGGGLAGCMLALLLGQKGVPVRVVEYREEALGWQEPAQPGHKVEVVKDTSDRKFERAAFGQLTDVKARSINLALSHRGIEALKKVGLFERVQKSLIPMEGRAVHYANGKVTLQPYGIDHQAIYSVSRTDLNNLLVEELEKLPNVELNFACKVSRVLRDGTVQSTNKDGHRVDFPSKFVIGADGAFSMVRQSMQRLARIDFSQMYLSHGYKELTIPPNAQGDFALPMHNALHIWPHHDFMLIALPNPDKTFTATLFAPWEGPDGLNDLVTEAKVSAYLNKNFPDAVKVMPHCVQEFLTNPSSPLLSIRCDPWVFEDKIALIGDAAHAAVPFYGQGMNCAFEDGLVFAELWDQLGGDASKVIPEFNKVRQPIGAAIVDLSLANFEEMGSKTVRPYWVAKRKVELLLHRMFPKTWIPQYNMVSFTRIPYHIAKQRAEKQDKLLGWGMALVGTAVVAGATKLAYDAWKSANGSPAQ